MTTPLAPSLAEWVEQAIWEARNIYAARNELFDRRTVERVFLDALSTGGGRHG